MIAHSLQHRHWIDCKLELELNSYEQILAICKYIDIWIFNLPKNENLKSKDEMLLHISFNHVREIYLCFIWYPRVFNQ